MARGFSFLPPERWWSVKWCPVRLPEHAFASNGSSKAFHLPLQRTLTFTLTRTYTLSLSLSLLQTHNYKL